MIIHWNCTQATCDIVMDAWNDTTRRDPSLSFDEFMAKVVEAGVAAINPDELRRLQAIETDVRALKAAYDGLDANPLPTPERLMTDTRPLEEIVERREQWSRERMVILARLFAAVAGEEHGHGT